MPEVWRNSTVPGRQEERVRINMGFEKKIDVTALGELLIDFTQNGVSEQGNNLFEANPGGAPCKRRPLSSAKSATICSESSLKQRPRSRASI